MTRGKSQFDVDSYSETGESEFKISGNLHKCGLGSLRKAPTEGIPPIVPGITS